MKIGQYDTTNTPAPNLQASDGDVKPIEDAEIKIESKQNFDTPGGRVIQGLSKDLEKDVGAMPSEEIRILNYKERLEEAGVSLDEAEEILDDVLMKGYYEETLPLTKKRTVRFRTRNHKVFTYALDTLESMNVRFANTEMEIMARYGLAGSLVAVTGVTLPTVSEKDLEKGQDLARAQFQARLDWVENQAEPLIRLLSQKLAEFDYKLAAVLSRGAADFI